MLLALYVCLLYASYISGLKLSAAHWHLVYYFFTHQKRVLFLHKCLVIIELLLLQAFKK